jgi:glutathione S-transferase
MPKDPWARAKLRELTQIIDLYLELAVRRVLPNYFARKPPPDRIAQDVRDTLTKGAKAVRALCSFDHYLLGDRFSAADVAAIIHFPMVKNIGKGALSFDPFEGMPELDAYLARLEERPHVKTVRADSAANFPEFAQHLAQMYGFGR